MRKYLTWLIVAMLIVQIALPGANRAEASSGPTYVLVNEAGNGTSQTPAGADKTKAKEVGFFGDVTDMVVDASGNIYFVLSYYNRVYKVTPEGDLIIIGGIGEYGTNPYTDETQDPAIGKKFNETRLSLVRSLALDSQNNLYIAERTTGKIYKVNLSTNEITHIYQVELGTDYRVEKIALNSAGILYVYHSAPDPDVEAGQREHFRVYKLGQLHVNQSDPSHGQFTQFTGFAFPKLDNQFHNVAVDKEDNLYFSRKGRDSSIWKYTSSTGELKAFASRTPGIDFQHPQSIVFDADNNAYFTTVASYSGDFGNQIIKVTQAGVKSLVAGHPLMEDGYSEEGTEAINAKLDGPNVLAIHPVNGTLYFDEKFQRYIRSIRPAYNIQYDGNEATGGDVPSIQRVYGGKPATIASQGSLVKEGHTFMGWTTALDGPSTDYATGATIVPSADLTLFAIWEPEKYNLIYNASANGTLTSGSLEEQPEIRHDNVPYNTTIDPVTAVPNSGYGFAGWSDGEQTATRQDPVTASLSVTASFLKQHSVTFNTYGGSTIDPIIVLEGRLLTLPTPPTNGEYSLDGWYLDSEWTTPFDEATTPITSDLTLYAKWATKYIVTLYPHNGMPESQISVTKATYMSPIADPVHTGYTFIDWYTDESYTQAFDYATPITGDMSLHAKWELAPPDAPAIETVTPGNARVELVWNGVPFATGYNVYQSTTSGAPGTVVATVTDSVYQYEATGLMNGTTYYYVVAAVNESGETASVQVSATPLTVAGVPTEVTAVSGNGKATITFNAPADNGGSAITGYRVTSSPGNHVVTTTNDSTTIEVTGLTNGTAYTFTVEALNGAGYGAASAASDAVTPMAVPGAPTDVAAVASNGKATITFTAPADIGGGVITGYRVTSSPDNIAVTTTNDDTTVEVTGLTNGTSYTFTVEALNGAGYGAASAASNAVTPMTVAGAPTGVTAVAGNGQATITFTAPADNGGSTITGYRVTSLPDNIVVTTTNNDTTVEVTGLTNGTSYTFTVEALNGVGYGAASVASNAVTPMTVASAPTEVTAVAGNAKATITFTAPTDNGGGAITGYRVTSSPDNIVVTTTNDDTTVEVTGLTNGTSYTFTVEALNGAGYGAASAASNTVTPVTVAGAPTGVAAVAGNGQATITFTAPTDNGGSTITGYRVTSSPDNIVVTTTNVDTTVEVTGLSNGTSYTFAVEALNAVGYGAASAASNAVTPMTVAGAPTGVAAVAGNEQATITFTAPTDNGGSAITGYRVTSSPGNHVVTTTNNDTTIEVTGLTNGTSYTFTVEALNGVGYGAASAASNTVTPKAVAGAPTGVTAVAGNGQATVSFTAPADNGGGAITGYRVTSSPDNIVVTTTNDDTTVEVTGLTNGTSYTFTVEALNGAGYGAASAASNAVTPMTVAGVPTGITAVAGNGQATITFTAPTDNGGSAITGYRVTSSPDNIVVTTTNVDTTVEVTGLTNGTSYTFTVEALNGVGYGAASAASHAVTPMTVASAPTEVTAVAGNAKATITFTAPTDNGGGAITGYRVTSSPDNIVVTTTNDDTKVEVTGLTNGTSYTFTVEALNGAGYGTASAASNAVTPTAPPSGNSAAELVVSTDGKLTVPIGAAGEVKLGEEIAVSIPAGASEQELRLTVEQVVDIAGLAEAGEVIVSPVFELLKNFTDNFVKPVVLTFKFDVTKVQEGQRASIFYYDETNKVWVEVGGQVDGDTISAEVDHFTKFTVLAVDVKAEKPELPSFSDIVGHWGEASIKQAVQQGIVSGYPDGTFKPNATVTRAEFTVMLANALKLNGESAPLSFTDEQKIGAWAKSAVAASVKAGIVSGYSDGSFQPSANISRTELAVMAARAYGESASSDASTGFADDSDIPVWAKSAIAKVKQLGIVSGQSGNRFSPNANATRAEAVTIILNMLNTK